MRILDKNNNEVSKPDYSLGYIQSDRIFVKHHEAIKGVEEQWHYEAKKVYANGGKDLERVIDVPAIEAQDAYDEYEEIGRYIPYTKEELEQRKKPTPDEDRDLMLIDFEYRLAMLEAGMSSNYKKIDIANIIERIVRNGTTKGLSEKIDLLFTVGRISKDQYSKFTSMISKKV